MGEGYPIWRARQVRFRGRMINHGFVAPAQWWRDLRRRVRWKQRAKTLQQPRVIFLRQLVLPDPNDLPAFRAKRSSHEAIARLILAEFLKAERRVVLRLEWSETAHLTR
jgi:hypothetical protein